MGRPTAFDVVLGSLMAERFPAIRQELDERGVSPRDRDAFVLARSAVTLLRELRPDHDASDSIDEFVGFVHAAFIFFVEGGAVVEVDRETLAGMLRESRPRAFGAVPGRAYYVELPEQRVWGEPIEGSPPEPLESFVVIPSGGGLEVVGLFGLHPGRPGLTVARAAGERDLELGRPDGSPPFASRLTGGERAGLFSLLDGSELLELAYRTHALLGADGARLGRQRVTIA